VQVAQGELQKVTRLVQVLGAENHGQGLFLHQKDAAMFKSHAGCVQIGLQGIDTQVHGEGIG
jgi:hypothetical protein